MAQLARPFRFELSIAKKPMFRTLVRVFSRQAALLFTNFREATVPILSLLAFYRMTLWELECLGGGGGGGELPPIPPIDETLIVKYVTHRRRGGSATYI